MQNKLPSLITSDAKAGLALAGRLSEQLREQLDQVNSKVKGPGGTNYGLPPSVPGEVAAGILFYAIAAANHGWVEQG